MSQSTIAAVVIALMLGFLAFALVYSQKFPREIVGSGTVLVRSERAGGGSATLKTRDVSINKVVFQEVEMPNGTWIDCAGDCTKSAREAGEGFWANQVNNKR